MKHLPGFISSLDPPMVTAEVEKPGGTSCMCWLCTSWYNTKLQEYHKAIEPMPVDLLTDRYEIEYIPGDATQYYKTYDAGEGDYFYTELKLHQKVEFTKTKTGCRITIIINK